MKKGNTLKIVLAAIIGVVVISSVVVPVSINAYYTKKQNAMQELVFCIEDLSVTDSFPWSKRTYEYTFKLRTDAQFIYQKYPEKIEAASGEYIFDNETTITVFGELVENGSYKIVLITKMNGYHTDKMINTFTVELAKKEQLEIHYPRAAGILILNYYVMLPVIVW
jgi:hypothetical protein